MGALSILSYLSETNIPFTLKLTYSIPPRQAANVIDASIFAWRNDLPLNRAITFNCSLLKIDSLVLAGRFTKLAGDWLRVNGSDTAHIWIREKPNNCDNLHLTTHVPEHLMEKYTAMQMRWLRTAGVRYRKNGIRSQIVGIGYGEKYRRLSDHEYLEHYERWIGYCLKGSTEEVCDELEIRHEPQGGIWGRRVGMSENISRKARIDAGFNFRRRGAVLYPSRVWLDRIA